MELLRQVIALVSRIIESSTTHSHGLDVWLNLTSSIVVAMGSAYLPLVLRHDTSCFKVLVEDINFG